MKGYLDYYLKNEDIINYYLKSNDDMGYSIKTKYEKKKFFCPFINSLECNKYDTLGRL